MHLLQMFLKLVLYLLYITQQYEEEFWLEILHRKTPQYPRLYTNRGDRAMLIKNNKGDWGLVVAYWEGFKQAVKGKQ